MKLTMQERIEDLRKEKSLTLEQLAEQTGLSRSALANYETNEFKDISHYAVVKLAKFYGVTADYLLGLTETKGISNVDASSLHLSDELIEMLRSEQLNVAMLNEIAVQPGFEKLLIDLEIYVNGLASDSVQALNAYVDTVREKIIADHHPERHDLDVRIIEALKISEDGYFCSRVHSDIDSIMQEIKGAREKRRNNVDQSLVNGIKKDLQEVISGQEKRTEDLLRLALIKLGIPYPKVSEFEKQTLLNLFHKSKLLRSGISKRGNKRKA